MYANKRCPAPRSSERSTTFFEFVEAEGSTRGVSWQICVVSRACARCDQPHLEQHPTPTAWRTRDFRSATTTSSLIQLTRMTRASLTQAECARRAQSTFDTQLSLRSSPSGQKSLRTTPEISPPIFICHAPVISAQNDAIS